MRVAMAFTITLFLLSACSYHVDKGGSQGLGTVPSYTKADLSYALVNQYVIGPKCVHCHGQSGGVSLETYAAVVHNLSAIEAAALIARSMPRAPTPPLSEAEAKLLREWIDAGAPELPGEGNSPSPPPVLEPKFAVIHDQIFAKKCLMCHNPGGSAKDVPLDTIADLLNSPDDLVVPGDPDNSYLAIVISPGARRPMPPPRSGLSLSPEEINTIKEWIKNGAKD